MQACNMSASSVIRARTQYNRMAGTENGIPLQTLKEMPQLRCNPFKDQIAAWASGGDKELGFDEYLDLVSTFAPGADLEMKLQASFEIYDFDRDGRLGRDDLQRVVTSILGESSSLRSSEADAIVDNILRSMPSDSMSYHDFRGAMAQSTDFASRFEMVF